MRILRGIAVAQGDNPKVGISAGDVLFSLNQITNPSLQCSSESTDAVDALNVPIATFYRAKSCEFSAENALFDMNLLAAQAGTTKKVANDAENITAPCFETIDILPATTNYELSHNANTGVKAYLLNGDGTLGEKILFDDEASGHVIARDGKDITIDLGGSGFTVGDQLFFMYEYYADGTAGNGAVEVVNSATNFPVGCKFIMEILGADVCDQTNLIYAYLINTAA